MRHETFLKLWHIQAVRRCAKNTAIRERKFLKDWLNKEPHQNVTILEYISYCGITDEEFDNAIIAYRQRKVLL